MSKNIFKYQRAPIRIHPERELKHTNEKHNQNKPNKTNEPNEEKECTVQQKEPQIKPGKEIIEKAINEICLSRLLEFVYLLQ